MAMPSAPSRPEARAATRQPQSVAAAMPRTPPSGRARASGRANSAQADVAPASTRTDGDGDGDGEEHGPPASGGAASSIAS